MHQISLYFQESVDAFVQEIFKKVLANFMLYKLLFGGFHL